MPDRPEQPRDAPWRPFVLCGSVTSRAACRTAHGGIDRSTWWRLSRPHFTRFAHPCLYQLGYTTHPVFPGVVWFLCRLMRDSREHQQTSGSLHGAGVEPALVALPCPMPPRRWKVAASSLLPRPRYVQRLDRAGLHGGGSRTRCGSRPKVAKHGRPNWVAGYADSPAVQPTKVLATHPAFVRWLAYHRHGNHPLPHHAHHP